MVFFIPSQGGAEDLPELQCRSKPRISRNGIGAAGDITIGGQQPLRQPDGLSPDGAELPNIAKLELALPATSPSAVSSRCTTQAARAGRDARARVFGDVFGAPSRRDKEHHRASRKCRSESMT